MVRSVGRQRVIIDDGAILIVLHRRPIDDYWKREGVFLLRTTNAAWRSKGERSARILLDSYRTVACGFDEEFEDACTPSALFALLDRLVSIRRSARNVHSVLSEAGKHLRGDTELAEWINFAYETERGLELLYDDIRHTIDSHLARIEEDHMELTKQSVIATNRLNFLVALFLPLATIASVLAMNLSHGINKDDPRHFIAVVVFGILLGVGVLWYLRSGFGERRD